MVGSIGPGGIRPQIPPDEISRIKQQVDELREKLQDLALQQKTETPRSKGPSPIHLLSGRVPTTRGQAVSPAPSLPSIEERTVELLYTSLNSKIVELWNTFGRTLDQNDEFKAKQFTQLATYILNTTSVEKVMQNLAQAAEMMPSEAKYLNELKAQLNQILATSSTPSFDFAKAIELLSSTIDAKIGELHDTYIRTHDWADFEKVDQYITTIDPCLTILWDYRLDNRTKIEKIILELDHCAVKMPSEAKSFNELQAQLKQILGK